MKWGILLLTLLVIPLFSTISFSYTLYGGALYCNTTCDDCEDALNNDTYTTVYLNSSLSSPGATCINNPSGFNNKIFDCQGNLISTDGSGTTYAVRIISKENITVRNCESSLFTGVFNIRYSRWINLTNNTEHYGRYDSYELCHSEYLVISNNTFWYTVQDGIELNNCSHSLIEHNFLNSSGIGIKSSEYLDSGISGSNNNSIFNNTFYNGSWFSLTISRDNRIVDNLIDVTGTGIAGFTLYPGMDEESCNNIITNFSRTDGSWLYFTNESVNLDAIDPNVYQIILCNADNSNITGITMETDSYAHRGVIRGAHLDNVSISNSTVVHTAYSISPFYFAPNITNLTLTGNTADGNGQSYVGFLIEGSAYAEGNTAFGNGYGFMLNGYNVTLRSNIVHDNEYCGIFATKPYDYWADWMEEDCWNSTGYVIDSNIVYGNKLCGVGMAESQNATITNNQIYSNGYGYSDPWDYASWIYEEIHDFSLPRDDYCGLCFRNAWNVTLANNSIYGNNYYGIALNASDNVTSTNDRVYGNGVADVISFANSASEFYLNGMLIHSSDYPNITITDVLEANTIYTIKQVSSPSTDYPDSLTAVQNRVLNITNITGSPTIDSLTIAWGTPEENYYNESTFDLWRYVTSWVDFNATLNTTANTLNYSAVPTGGAYGILGIYTYEEHEESDDECDSDLDCGECEECNAGACVLPPGACLTDSGCTGEGETCSSCECIPPECLRDEDCPPGYSCENYLCVEIPQEESEPAPEPEVPPEPEPPTEPSQEPGVPQEPEPLETPDEAPEPSGPSPNQSGQVEVLSPDEGAGEGSQVREGGTMLSDTGCFVGAIGGAILLYFLLTRIFPGLPGGKDW